ncbi:hypothetical protein [Flavobacterium sp. RS13.1]|uniref:hypothetical protein n=1 Tax=Flavobacterium sp. RS13.1 TaxID=3400345 RepID=UPI003AAABA62
MKKYFICFLTLLGSDIVLAQNDTIQKLREMTEKSKSGNYKDILSSIFQLGTTNLTSDNKSIEFNATLFGIKSIFNSHILEDKYFKRERFSRNLQFNAKLNLDEQFKYNGVSGGITYALINKRDKDVADFTNTVLEFDWSFLADELSAIQSKFAEEITNSAVDISVEINSLDVATKILINKEFDKIDKSNIYFEKIITEFEKRNKSIKLKNYVENLHLLKDNLYSEIEKKPLWTVSLLGTTNDKGDNKKVSFGSIFLKGFKHFELDIQSKLIYSDTLINNSLKRIESKSSAGVNYKMFKRNEQSVFEIKLYMEYNSILKNQLADEKKNTFLASSDFRLRVTDDLWIPLTIKYDIEKSNFLGFLNITYNFGNSDSNGDLKLNKL